MTKIYQLSMDESPKHLMEDVKPSIPMKVGQDARVDYEYIKGMEL